MRNPTARSRLTATYLAGAVLIGLGLVLFATLTAATATAKLTDRTDGALLHYVDTRNVGWHQELAGLKPQRDHAGDLAGVGRAGLFAAAGVAIVASHMPRLRSQSRVAFGRYLRTACLGMVTALLVAGLVGMFALYSSLGPTSPGVGSVSDNARAAAAMVAVGGVAAMILRWHWRQGFAMRLHGFVADPAT